MKYYKEIKNELENYVVAKYVKNISINKSELKAYFNIGKMLHKESFKNDIVKKYSKELSKYFISGCDTDNLRRMIDFYKLIESGVKIPLTLDWQCISLLLNIKDIDEIKYYINVTCEKHLSYEELFMMIKYNEYENIDIETRNEYCNKEIVNPNDLFYDFMIFN